MWMYMVCKVYCVYMLYICNYIVIEYCELCRMVYTLYMYTILLSVMVFTVLIDN